MTGQRAFPWPSDHSALFLLMRKVGQWMDKRLCKLQNEWSTKWTIARCKDPPALFLWHNSATHWCQNNWDYKLFFFKPHQGHLSVLLLEKSRFCEYIYIWEPMNMKTPLECQNLRTHHPVSSTIKLTISKTDVWAKEDLKTHYNT